MSIRISILAALIAAAAVPAAAQKVAAPAQAQAQPQGQPLGGPLVAGVCLLSREAVFANAAAGRAASTQLQALTKAAQTEIDAARAPLETEAKALDAPSLTDAQRQQRRQALQQRLQALHDKAANDGREIEATRLSAMGRIANEAQPVIAQVYAAKHCGLLLDRASALGGNFGNDLTAEVVAGLDKRLPTLKVEREHPPQQAAGQ